MAKYIIHNFITGLDETLDDEIQDGPTQEWVEGWECYMHNGLTANPYEEGSFEWWEWQDGHDAAERD